MKNKIYYLFIYLSFCILLLNGLTYTSFSGIYSSIINYLSIFMSLFIIIIYIFNRKFSNFIIVFIIYIFLLMVSCFFGEYSSLKIFFDIYLEIVSIVFLMDMSLKYNSIMTIKIIRNILFVFILINTLSIIIYPNGLYTTYLYRNNWFLLYDNMHILTYFPALLLSIIYDKKNNNKNRIITILLLIMTTYSVYYCFSANSVFAYTVFLLYLIFSFIIDSISFFNSKNYFITYILFFFTFIHFRIQNGISKFIVLFLNKDITFSGRTIIWDKIVYYISERPLLGYGIEYNSNFVKKMGNVYYTHAHNTIYDILYKGGVLSLSIFLWLLVIVCRKLYQYKNNKIAKLISMVLLCFFIMMNFESRQEKIGFWILLVLGYNVEYLI